MNLSRERTWVAQWGAIGFSEGRDNGVRRGPGPAGIRGLRGAAQGSTRRWRGSLRREFPGPKIGCQVRIKRKANR